MEDLHLAEFRDVDGREVGVVLVCSCPEYKWVSLFSAS